MLLTLALVAQVAAAGLDVSTHTARLLPSEATTTAIVSRPRHYTWAPFAVAGSITVSAGLGLFIGLVVGQVGGLVSFAVGVLGGGISIVVHIIAGFVAAGFARANRAAKDEPQKPVERVLRWNPAPVIDTGGSVLVRF